jgi:hypothetical protein
MNLTDVLSGLRGSEGLNQAADQAGLDPGQAHDAMHGVLEHLAAGGGVEEAANVVAGKLGVSPDQVQALLPQILPLLQGHAEGATGEAQGMLGGLIGRFLGGLH